MSKKQIEKAKKNSDHVTGFQYVKTTSDISEYVLKVNGLRVLFMERPDTGIVTTNITYFVGSRDEARGETGVAHMLEHMLFKPTEFDIKAGTESAAMLLERETGCILNANTWKDRTTYYFSYPREYFDRALVIEAQRMTNVVLTDASLFPERNNVLSEHDMYNGDPYFALGVAMSSAAFRSHPYGHETIGHREDIEQYNAAALEKFYRLYYRPDNAVLMIVGDIDVKTALTSVKKHFAGLTRPTVLIPRFNIKEPIQEGIRRTTVERVSETNIVSIGVKQTGFPTEDWYVASALFEILTDGPESVLHRALIDTGMASSVDGGVEPCSEAALATLTITLAKGYGHLEIEEITLAELAKLNSTVIAPLLKKVKAKMLTDELFARDSSLRIVQELTEYTSAGNWSEYTRTVEILDAITPKKVLACVTKLFTKKNMTVGYFISAKK